MTDLSGLTIENYLLEKQIGAGGMAQVFYARSYQDDRRSAGFKVAHPHLAQDAAFRELFLQEAQINRRLHHPGILRIQASGEWWGDDAEFPLPYLITEHAAGGSLAIYLLRLARQKRHLPLESGVKAVMHVADALAHAHQQNVLHLDLKPDNLLLRQPGSLSSVAVADFGTMAVLLAGQDVQQVMGTPSYMSPEQLVGAAVDARTDLYALGVILYELVVGKRPFSAPSPLAIYQQQQQPLDLTDAPASLRPILQTALAFAPENRYQTAADMGDALRRRLHAQSGQPQNGSVPQGTGETHTRLQAAQWLPPVTQLPEINYQQRWVGGFYRFFIVHQNGRITIQTVTSEQRMLEIGRQPGIIPNGTHAEIGAIRLADPHVSARHAVLERAGNGWQVFDDDSKNGTYLAGKRLEKRTPTYWRGRVPLRVGPYVLIWESYTHHSLTNEQANHAYRQEESDWNRLISNSNFWLTSTTEQDLSVTCDPPDVLRIKPGETAQLTLTLLTQSAVVERVEVALKGIPPTWFTIPQIDYAPLAGIPLSVPILIHPPEKESAAGEHQLEIVVFSPVNNREQYRGDYTIEIAPTAGMAMDLHPKNLRGEGMANLMIWNTGNEEAKFLVQARDPAEAMVFEPSEETITVAAGASKTHGVQVVPVEKRPFLPPSKILPYELRVGRSETEMRSLNGQVELRPVFPGWLLIVIPLVAILLYFAIPALVSRQAARNDMRDNAEAQMAAAEKTAVSAQATIAIGEAMLGGLAEVEGTPSAEIQAVQEDVAQAKADLAAAEAAMDQAEEAAAAADDMGAVGPAIPPAEPPTAISLDNNTIAEDSPTGAIVGLLISEDANEEETHSYALVAGEGNANNGLFSVEGSQLKLLGTLDFETQPELSVRVESRDSRGETFAQRLTVQVSDANEPFTMLALSNNTVEENALSATVGDVTAVDDPDQNDVHIFTLAGDPSGVLEISGASLRVKTGMSLDHEAFPDGLPVQIKATDGGGNEVTQELLVLVTDVNDPPTVADFGKVADEDTPLTFATSDFVDNFSDTDEDALVNVKITQLPANGLLKFREDFVFEGQELSPAQLSNLVFEPERNFNGRLSFKWTASDGEAFAQQDATMTLTISPVPDPATFSPDSSEIVVDEDAPQQNFNWAIDIRNQDGDVDDLRFVVCSNTNTALFATGPSISKGGNLIFTPTPDQNGAALLQILLTDQPQPDGGDETAVCANQITTPLTITIQPVNDAPIITTQLTITHQTTQIVQVFPDIDVQEPDKLPDSKFRFEGGSIEIFLSGQITETLALVEGYVDRITISNDEVSFRDNPIGTIQNNDSASVRIIDLTEHASLNAIEALLKSLVLYAREANSVFVHLSLNDGGNIDEKNLPKTTTVVVFVE